jgi:hypothetical protein
MGTGYSLGLKRQGRGLDRPHTAWKSYLIVTVLLITRCPVSINYKHFSGSHYEQKTDSIVIDSLEEKNKLIRHANRIRKKLSKLMMNYEMVKDTKDSF